MQRGQFEVVELTVKNQFKAFSINLNALHVNGMTLFELAVHVRISRDRNIVISLIRVKMGRKPHVQ